MKQILELRYKTRVLRGIIVRAENGGDFRPQQKGLAQLLQRLQSEDRLDVLAGRIMSANTTPRATTSLFIGAAERPCR